MRKNFQKQLDELNMNIVKMATTTEESIEMAITALINHDTQLAERVILIEKEIDEMEREIENICLKLILHQQPIAGDLRFISAALKMITDMERIGDHAYDISEITLMIEGDNYLKHTDKIEEMAKTAKIMLKESIDSYVNKDLNLAHEVIKKDDIVDDLFVEIKSDLVDLIRENKENGQEALDLLMIAKYLERIGDHAENIAEWVEFFITGEHKK